METTSSPWIRPTSLLRPDFSNNSKSGNVTVMGVRQTNLSGLSGPRSSYQKGVSSTVVFANRNGTIFALACDRWTQCQFKKKTNTNRKTGFIYADHMYINMCFHSHRKHVAMLHVQAAEKWWEMTSSSPLRDKSVFPTHLCKWLWCLLNDAALFSFVVFCFILFWTGIRKNQQQPSVITVLAWVFSAEQRPTMFQYRNNADSYCPQRNIFIVRKTFGFYFFNFTAGLTCSNCWWFSSINLCFLT